MKKTIDVTFLGGVNEIGKSLTVLEFANDFILVDCGCSFSADNVAGIDAVLPDITYIRELRKKKSFKGIVLTHGHEDHMGAIPYYANEFNVPIYGTALTLGLLQRKLDYEEKKANTICVKPGDIVELGCFRVEFIKVAHSMGGACALNIETPIGRVFVTGDFKMDETPIDGKKTDTKRICEIGDEGVLLMLGESTNVERKGHSVSEKTVGKQLDKIIQDNPYKRITIACFASSNYRVQQVLNLAKKYNRKVVLAGKSMRGMVDVASSCGELTIPKGIIADSVKGLQPKQTIILATGSQGEPLSALKKMSKGSFNKINLGEDDLVIFSSTPIPGNEKAVFDVINDLFRKNTSVIYDALHDIHASGHAYEDELVQMLRLVRPQCFMPVHGEYRHQVLHANLALDNGVALEDIAIPVIGNKFGVNQQGIHPLQDVPSGNVYVDDVVLEDGKQIVQDRKALSEFGLILVIASVDLETGHMVGDASIIGRGCNISMLLEEQLQRVIKNAINTYDGDTLDSYALEVKHAIKKVFSKNQDFPMIIPLVLEV